MAATKIADIVVPDVFTPYLIEKTAELVDFFFGGVLERDPFLDELARSGGKLLQVPFFKDLTGVDEVLADGSALTAGAITTGKDIGVLHMRGRAWGVNDLAKALSGDDPMKAIADLAAAYWARRMQALAITSLQGVIADNEANDSGDMVYNIALETTVAQDATNWFSADAVIAAAGTMGDNAEKLTAIAVHSTVFQAMQNQNVISFIAPGGADIKLPFYLSKYRVIVDDGLPKVAGTTSGFKYDSYLFGSGALAFGEGEAPVPVETDRDSLAGEDYLITRRHFLMHPHGIKFISGSVAGESPTNAETALAANWDRVYARKNVRVAVLRTNTAGQS